MDSKRVLIIGNHPIIENVISQYVADGFDILYYSGTNFDETIDEIFVATSSDGGGNSEDLNNIDIIARICNNVKESDKIIVHLLLHDPYTLKMFQRKELCADFKKSVEIFPFTIESLWSQNILVNLPNSAITYPYLDREFIERDSNKCVHVVLFHMNSMSETLAEYIAFTSHYANYTRDHSLRTRITIVDNDILLKKNEFINKYKALFDNSYYRTINLDSVHDATVIDFHKPLYHKTREDFVDIEWEFVKADINNGVLRDKLVFWSKSDNKLLSLFVCSDSDNENIKDLLLLPNELMDNDIPVFLRTMSSNIANMVDLGKNVITFGGKKVEYDITLPLVRLAKMVNFVYDSCYEDNYVNDDNTATVYMPISIEMNRAEQLWNKLSTVKKWSNIYNAMTIVSKMRALSYSANNWKDYYGMSSKEIELIAELEHNRWNVEELILGYTPVDDIQEKEIENDVNKKNYYKKQFIHYDIRAYKDLRNDASGKNVSTYDICLAGSIPLIANTFISGLNNE